MPKLQDIEQFKASLRSLGRETEILARWGESWHDLEAPPQGVPDDIANLLETGDDSLEAGATGDEQPAADDFAAFLDDMSLGDVPTTNDVPPDDFEVPGGFQEVGPESFEDDFSVPSSLLEGFDALTEPDEEIPEAEEASEAEEIPELEPETVPELEAEEIQELEAEEISELEAEEISGFEAGTIPALEAEPAQEAEELPEAAETFGLDDLDSFSAGPSEPETTIPDDFSMTGFEDFGIAAEPDISGEAPAEEPAASAPADEPAEPSFDLGSESMEGDSFDQFDLGGASQETTVPELGTSDFEDQIASLDGEATTADNFSLDSGWGGDFTIPGFEMGGETPAPAAKPQKTAPAGQLAGAFGAESPRVQAEKKARPVELTDDQADALQDTLLSYPLNLRLAVEDIVANGKGSEVQQSDLVWMLVEGAAAKDSAKLAGKILKRYIEVPTGFAKRTGAAFEAEKGSFRYIFVHSILPVLQVLVLVAAGVGALFYLGYSFAYKPLKANSLYAEGLKQVGLAKYGESMEFFERADKEWSMKGWHYRYAEAYVESAQYPRAEAMYERLLRNWPKETKAALDYAGMEMAIFDFAKTESVLQQYILGRDYFNKEALLLSSENFLAWADFEEQRYEGPDTPVIDNLYEKARLQLATLMERHGRSDDYLELMLLYFIRTERFGKQDNRKEILPLSTYFIGNTKSQWSASTLAELGDYLLDRDETENINAVLLAAVDRDGTLPEAHVAMARWNRRSGFEADELKALEYAARFYAEADAKTGLSTKRTKRYLESLIRLGELRREDGRSLDAEDAFNTAIERYERGLSSRQFKRTPAWGRAYALLADIYYAERMDFRGALELYAEAERNGYVSPETDYRRGYIHYMEPADDGSAALGMFYRAALDTDPSPYLQWATANALYARDDFFAAQGYYSMLANRLQFELDTLALPSPQTKPSHNEIVELLMMTRNNLGASLYRVAERIGDARRRSEAMVEFTESARLYDSLSRDQRTMLRPESRNLGFLNLDFVLHPLRGIDLGIYKILPTEMAYPRK